MAFEALKRAAGANVTFIPYPGIAPAVNAILGGRVTSYWGVYRDVSEQIGAGQLRAIATADRSRSGPVKDLQTLADYGYADVKVGAWFGLFAPARTPQGTVSQLAQWFTAALRVPDVKARLEVQGLYPDGTCGPDFAADIRRQYDDYGRIIRAIDFKLE